MLLRVRPGTDQPKRHALVEDWYREQIKKAVPPLLARWQLLMGVRVERFFVQRMKTKWGSCNHKGRAIRLNTQLAKKPPECLEYIVVHEWLTCWSRRTVPGSQGIWINSCRDGVSVGTS